MTTDHRPLLRVAGLHVRYPAVGNQSSHHAVRGVSFTIDSGEVLGLVGSSGCGKSSILAAIGGLSPVGAQVRADELSLAGTDLTRLDRSGWQQLRRRDLGLVPQQPMTSLVATVGVGRQLGWYLGPDAIGRHEETLRSLGLDQVVERPNDLPSQFSGGQLQRLLIAINTVARRPRLLLADEPTSTLDVTIQAAVLDHLRDSGSKGDMAMLLVSHDLAVVSHIADRVGVIDRGHLVELATVEQVFEDPTHPVTQALVGAVPRRTPSTQRPQPEPPTPQPSPAPATPGVTPANDIRDSDGTPLLEVIDASHRFVNRPTRLGIRREPRQLEPVDADNDLALKSVSLALTAHESVALVGASGSGKSTLARVMVGAVQPDHGSVLLGGRLLSTPRCQADRRRIQLVPQNTRAALNPRRRVGHALEQAQRVHGLGVDAQDRRNRASAILKTVHLDPALADRRPAELSGGELARVILARALLVEPTVLILDEPTSSLDAGIKQAVLETITEVRSRLDVALLVITHELSVARTLAERVVVLHEGRVVEEGPTGQILSAPDHPHTRELLASELSL